MTQELSHGGGSVREAVYKHSVTSESMETDSPEKHSCAGHDCANYESLDKECSKMPPLGAVEQVTDPEVAPALSLRTNAASDPAMDSQV